MGSTGSRIAAAGRAARSVALVSGLLLAGCGAGTGTTGDTGGSAVMQVEVQGIPSDATDIHFKIYRADCFGAHPCSTWLAETGVTPDSQDPRTYQLSLPAEVLAPSIYLRVETTSAAASCVGAQATTTAAKSGADYVNTVVRVSLDGDSAGPPFQVTTAGVCPVIYAPQGAGMGTVVLARPGAADITESSIYPEEVPRASRVTVTALQKGGSRFTMWAAPASCAGQTQSSCSFYVNDRLQVTPVFETL